MLLNEEVPLKLKVEPEMLIVPLGLKIPVPLTLTTSFEKLVPLFWRLKEYVPTLIVELFKADCWKVKSCVKAIIPPFIMQLLHVAFVLRVNVTPAEILKVQLPQ